MSIRVDGLMSEKQLKTHKDLDVWKRGIELVTEVYKVTKTLPNEETYGLCSQMQRAAVSIPSNIAEGAARSTTIDYIRYLYISLGSLSELETQIIICIKLKYLDEKTQLLSEIESIRKMLLNLIKYLKTKK